MGSDGHHHASRRARNWFWDWHVWGIISLLAWFAVLMTIIVGGPQRVCNFFYWLDYKVITPVRHAFYALFGGW